MSSPSEEYVMNSVKGEGRARHKLSDDSKNMM